MTAVYKDDHCRKGCGIRLKFDPSIKSNSGKMIPLELETGLRHNCPNSNYAKSQRGEVIITTPYPPSSPQLDTKPIDSNIEQYDKQWQEEMKDIAKLTLEAIINMNISLQGILHPGEPTIQKASELNDIGLSEVDVPDDDREEQTM